MMEEDGGSSDGHHHHHEHEGSEKFEPNSKESNAQQDEFSVNQADGEKGGCDMDGHSHMDVNLEEE